jgi:hypothetical protein
MVRWTLLVALAVAGACTLFDEDLPSDACTTDTDCFRAQGEVCNQQTKTCEMRAADAGVDTAPVAAEEDAP